MPEYGEIKKYKSGQHVSKIPDWLKSSRKNLNELILII